MGLVVLKESVPEFQVFPNHHPQYLSSPGRLPVSKVCSTSCSQLSPGEVNDPYLLAQRNFLGHGGSAAELNVIGVGSEG